MVINNVVKLGSEFEKRAGDNYKDNLDLFFVREYKDMYIEYTKATLGGIIERINGYNGGIQTINKNSDEN